MFCQRDALVTRRRPQIHVSPGVWQEHKLEPKYLTVVTQYWVIVVVQSLSPVQVSATHGLQHISFPCSSPSLGFAHTQRPLTWSCYLTISSCHPLLLLLSVFPSIGVFSSESALHIRWPKYWSFCFGISLSNTAVT